MPLHEKMSEFSELGQVLDSLERFRLVRNADGFRDDDARRRAAQTESRLRERLRVALVQSGGHVPGRARLVRDAERALRDRS